MMAEKEKAVFDYIYLAQKGLRSPDVSEFDLSEINKNRLNDYLARIKYKI